MYDAIVVGARCAGSPTAMLLARKGYRVLLVDRASFPSDTLSTHYIHQPGVARLKRWGLLDRVVASNCPPVAPAALRLRPVRAAGTPPPVDGVADGYAPRRTRARQDPGRGRRGGRRGGARALLGRGARHGRRAGRRHPRPRAGGATVTEQARIVVGADGLHSLVARSVRAPDLQRAAGAHLRLLHLLERRRRSRASSSTRGPTG